MKPMKIDNNFKKKMFPALLEAPWLIIPQKPLARLFYATRPIVRIRFIFDIVLGIYVIFARLITSVFHFTNRYQ